ncbi:MAG: hypothetical protein LBF86_03305 [Helicobacteraceae bacterium]|jgi:hypothetical protein|nr:hypothetical protein [Helicobacteraceae bacterium]
MPKKRSEQAEQNTASEGEEVKPQAAELDGAASEKGGETQGGKKRCEEAFANAWNWAKNGAKRAAPYVSKAASFASNWAWDNAATVLAIAAAALVGGVFGLIVALAVFAVLSYYRSRKEREE